MNEDLLSEEVLLALLEDRLRVLSFLSSTRRGCFGAVIVYGSGPDFRPLWSVRPIYPSPEIASAAAREALREIRRKVEL